MPFRIALSGLHGAAADLKVTGNNIANAATTGFKHSRAEFVDVYAAAYGAITQVTNGSGSRTANIRQIFSQGNIEYTDNATDLAITGQGFFIVEDDKGRYLTRNGTFGLDRDGYVVNATGQTLKVFPPVNNGAATTTFNTGSLQDLQLSTTIGAPTASRNIDVNLNVDADVTAIDIAVGGLHDDGVGATPLFDPTDPSTYHHVTATTVYDSLGAPHVVTMYFRKVSDIAAGGTIDNAWQMFMQVDGTDVPTTDDGLISAASGGTGAGTPSPGRPTALLFNPDGSLQEARYLDAGSTSQPTLTNGELVFDDFPVTTGANDVQLTVDFANTTQYGSEFAVNTLSQDGFTTGRLTGFDVEENGIVFARYTNGDKQTLGMVALANVPNPQGLRQKGDSLWVETFDAGDTTLGQPGTASLGLIQSGALEASTVEIADQLVNMIVAQRNYQANAQVVSTADQITQTLLQIR